MHPLKPFDRMRWILAEKIVWSSNIVLGWFSPWKGEVLSLTGLFDVSYIVRKRRLGLFGHVARTIATAGGFG